ncbi:hypothetical protein IM660_12795 [Ruania alkalisoli]|uniref:Uncharacterized protein n=1 Tax=Ruania alkalisoli TaxID=2779775 RepID=A0A7M1SRE7_9MICO|nr:hypothetical protein [Ruania alkalisoli]QOR69554.1 hypothetical protein IM660_12795 [Ruania alkalisoli]
MTVQDRRSNRVVYAKIRVPESTMIEHTDVALAERGWTFVSHNRERTVALPLYCARSAAMSVARSELDEFSAQRAPVIVDEIRLVEPGQDRRRRVAVAHTRRTWVNLIPRRWRESGDVAWDPAQWHVWVKRNDSDDAGNRRDVIDRRAHRSLAASELPGGPFDPAVMVTTTPQTEPRKVVRDPWEHPWRSIGFVLSFVTATLLIVAGFVLPWLDLAWWMKVPGVSIAAAGVVAMVLWTTWDRRSRLLRAGYALCWIAVAAVLGLCLDVLFTEASRSDPGALDTNRWSILVRILPWLAAAIATVMGWVHLFRLNSRWTKLLSLPALAALAAIAAWVAELLIVDGMSVFGLTSADVGEPAFRALATADTLMRLGALGAICGGVWGWLRYYGFDSGDRISLGRLMLTILLSIVTVALFLVLAAALLLWGRGVESAGG